MQRYPALLVAVALLVAQEPRKPTVFLVGDSTMADKPKPEQNPERGWGQLLPTFLDDSVAVRNFAVNGRSSKSFIDEGRWETILGQLTVDDYVLVQFGHNDEKQDDPSRYTIPYTGYRRNLERFVTEARARGATPILCSSIVRRHFNPHGTLEDTHGAYPLVARQVARELDVPFIDLQRLSEDLVTAAGVEGSKALYVWVAPGASSMFPDGRQDDTHLSVRGATAIARLAARALRESRLPIGRHVRGVD